MPPVAVEGLEPVADAVPAAQRADLELGDGEVPTGRAAIPARPAVLDALAPHEMRRTPV